MLTLFLGFSLASVPTIVDTVTDSAGLLDPSEEAALDGHIRRVREATGVQIALLTIRTLPADTPIETYSMQVAEQWQGGGERDDGILVTLAWNDRRSRIEVGYGLEGYITDAEAGQLLSDAAPHLRERDVHGALDSIVTGLHLEVASLTPDASVPLWRTAYGRASRLLPPSWALSLMALLYGALTIPWVVWSRRKRGYPQHLISLAQRFRLPILAGWLAGWAAGVGLIWLLGQEGDGIRVLASGVVGSLVQLPIGYARKEKDLRWGLGSALTAGGLVVLAYLGFVYTGEPYPEFLFLFYGIMGGIIVFAGAISPRGGGGGGGGSYHTTTSSSSYDYGSSSSSDSSSSGGGDWGGGGGGFGGGGASGSW